MRLMVCINGLIGLLLLLKHYKRLKILKIQILCGVWIEPLDPYTFNIFANLLHHLAITIILDVPIKPPGSSLLQLETIDMIRPGQRLFAIKHR